MECAVNLADWMRHEGLSLLLNPNKLLIYEIKTGNCGWGQV